MSARPYRHATESGETGRAETVHHLHPFAHFGHCLQRGVLARIGPDGDITSSIE